MRTGTLKIAAAGALLALPLLTIACSDGSKPAGSSSGAAAGTGAATAAIAAGSTSVSASGSASAAPAGPTCALDEASYVEWDEWGKGCGFAVPKAPSALPPRNNWEACGSSVGLSGCKKLKPRAGAALTGVLAGEKRENVVEIAYVEECVSETSRHAQLVISEADGPTLAAFASKGHERGKCDIEIASLHQGAYTARLNEEAGPAGTGAFVGAPTQTSKPAVLFAWEAGKAPRGAVASDLRWVVFGPDGARTARWGDSQPDVLTQDALNIEPSLNHDEIFWADVEAFVVRTAAKVEKLRGAEDDSTSSLGTDGRHLVMTHKKGGADAKVSLIASPYADEAGKLAFESVLPLPRAPGAEPWVVGCGYAAHATGQNEALIVRLKDGVSWTAASKGCEAGGLCFDRPMAVTCSDVFFAASSKEGQERTIVRVTFGGLGKGKSPASPPAPLGAPAASASGAPAASASAAPPATSQ